MNRVLEKCKSYLNIFAVIIYTLLVIHTSELCVLCRLVEQRAGVRDAERDSIFGDNVYLEGTLSSEFIERIR